MERNTMDLFILQVDGLDVAVTESEAAAIAHARRLASDDSTHEIKIVRIRNDWLDVIPRFPVAEAAIA
jgi:hypothetical protein